jgi:hypothetical protein
MVSELIATKVFIDHIGRPNAEIGRDLREVACTLPALIASRPSLRQLQPTTISCFGPPPTAMLAASAARIAAAAC